MNRVLRSLAFACVLFTVPVVLGQGGPQGGPPPGGGQGGFPGGGQGGRGPGQGGPNGGRGGRGGSYIPNAPAGALAGRTDIYTSANGTTTVGKKTQGGEYFFIIGSVDYVQNQILLKWPTEVTLLLKVTPNTKFTSEAEKPLKFSDFGAGDTVWVSYSGTGEDATAVSVRAGIMDAESLHKYYLNYDVNGNGIGTSDEGTSPSTTSGN